MRWDLPKEINIGEKKIVSRWAFPFPIVVENKKLWVERYWVVQVWENYKGKDVKHAWNDKERYLRENKPKPNIKKKSSHYLDA